jgi:hypothetical protein
MTPQESQISVIDPISPAIERVKTILFRPFDIGKWFVIGFCAWLAYLGSGGGRGGPNFNFPGRQQRHGPQIQEALNHAKEVTLDNLFWILPVAIIAVVVMIIIGLVITWLSSRGHFMFLHCVALNKAEVKAPWRKFNKQANSLFLFRIVVGLIGFAFVMLLIATLVVISVFLLAGRGDPNPLGIIFIVLLALCLILPTAIAFALIKKFTLDFVVPIMFLRQGTCMTAWREFWKLLTGNKGKFTLYILFQMVIAIAVGAIIMAGVCVTCCCLGCILAIPYIGTVLLLPILVFDRSYTLLYLRQYGPSFDVLSPEIATT